MKTNKEVSVYLSEIIENLEQVKAGLDRHMDEGIVILASRTHIQRVGESLLALKKNIEEDMRIHFKINPPERG